MKQLLEKKQKQSKNYETTVGKEAIVQKSKI